MATSNKLKSSSGPATGDAALRKALSRLRPPTAERTLNREVVALAHKIEAMLASGKVRSSELESALKQITSEPATPPRILDIIINLSSYIRQGDSIALLLNSLYVPQNDVGTELVLPDHTYFFGSTSATAPSAASASAATGAIAATAVVNANNVSPSPASAFGAVWVEFKSASPAYGAVNLVTAEAQVDWQGTVSGNGDYAWGSNVAGTLSVTGTITIAAFELNPATGLFDPTPGNNAEVYEVFQVANQRGVDSLSTTSYKGRFKSPNAVSLRFTADPGKTYAVALFAQVQISNSFTGLQQGSKAPTPPQGFGWSGTLSASVPYVLVSHIVTAK